VSETSPNAAQPEVLWASNAQAVEIEAVPQVPASSFADRCAELCAGGGRLSALVALPESQVSRPGARELLAVLADDQRARLALARTEVRAGASYSALSARLPQAQAFEREIFETLGVLPDGHPWLKPLRRHADLEPEPALLPAPPPHPFFQVDGHGIHEVAVGPVHAGIIEPGHFRFQCHGETVSHLEIQLGYQHRGAVELFLRSSPARRLVIAESIAGDTAVGHGLAHCMAVEALAGVDVSLGAQAARGIALELERLANHTGDLGALCNDVGYLPGASWFGRLRGDLLNLLLAWSGNRFGRGLVRPGGVRFGLSPAERHDLRRGLDRIERDLRETAELMLGTSSVVARFERTGTVPRTVAEDLGLVGPVARASGCDRDVRRDHPHGIYRFAHIPVATAEHGDVLSRALVRWLEIQRSIAFVQEQLLEMQEDGTRRQLPPLRPRQVVIALVEGWRGEIAHVAATAADGTIRGYSFVDPSFHNWFGLTVALRENQISDFPLCNKSFNLSYAGHDL
jgi:Ni,Fe-hydrogenase III large subunit/Ni,Fe-hydrogenase III component G